jgi:hypothetical protein
MKGSEAKDVIKRLKPTTKLSRDAAALSPTFMLGYRGLVIDQVEKPVDDLPQSFRVVHGDLFGMKLAHRAVDDKLEADILQSSDILRALGLKADFAKVLKTR